MSPPVSTLLADGVLVRVACSVCIGCPLLPVVEVSTWRTKGESNCARAVLAEGESLVCHLSCTDELL